MFLLYPPHTKFGGGVAPHTKCVCGVGGGEGIYWDTVFRLFVILLFQLHFCSISRKRVAGIGIKFCICIEVVQIYVGIVMCQFSQINKSSGPWLLSKFCFRSISSERINGI